MELMDNIISRIRWKSVIILIVAILVIAIAFSSINLFPSGYKGTDDIRVRTWLDPSTINLKGESIVWIEVMNTGKDDIWIRLGLNTDDPALLFRNTGRQNTTEVVKLGPGESRKLDFKVRLDGALYGGNYGINILLEYEDEEIEDKIYLRVTEKD